MPPPDQKKHAFQAPKGTRDFYPEQMLRRRYIEKAWRDTAIRHGFEEIDGPTFEHTELYTVKSGDAILGEVFNVFSGKDEEQVKGAAAGRAPFALRPEFTPTLARMYAAQAGSLPKPTKWFWQQNCYRAERPQRGRLREFGQWNVDFVGTGGGDEKDPAAIEAAKAKCDSEVLSCVIDLLRSLGLTANDVVVRINSRQLVENRFNELNIEPARRPAIVDLIDAWPKMEEAAANARAATLGLSEDQLLRLIEMPAVQEGVAVLRADVNEFVGTMSDPLDSDAADWIKYDSCIVRGLAYYTGMVFEVHEASGAERAIAGGGRYDNLIELFGGPPTPAVGFGMGDVVLGNILDDRGLMPKGKALLDKLSEPPASLRPDVFVIANDQPESQAALRPLVAELRRAGLHARHSYKTTKNIGKLLKEASDASSRFAAIIESGSEVTLKSLDAGTQEKVPLPEVATRARH
jgi:histidyl-tRNA synthetase